MERLLQHEALLCVEYLKISLNGVHFVEDYNCKNHEEQLVFKGLEGRNSRS